MHGFPVRTYLRIAAAARGVLLGVAVALVVSGTAAAQTFPIKPVRMVIPFGPGAATDTVTRAVAQKLSGMWGQPVVVDNRPGAATAIGAEQVARSAPDGYTLLLAAIQTLAINHSLFPKLTYDPMRDFAMVRGLFAAKHILAVHSSLPARTLAELISYARASGNKLSYGSPGNGSPSHLNMELFKRQAGLSMVHVPYKGGAPAMTDLVGGQIQMMLINISITLPHIKSGRLRALAMAGDVRSPVLPDVPTFAEAGFPGFESNTWFGLVAPAGTPRAIVDRISADAATVISLPEIRDKNLAEQGLEPFALDPVQFASHVKRDSEKFARLIRQIGVTPD